MDIEFLNSCIKNDLIPKFVQFRVANKGLRTSSIYRECQRKFLYQEITDKKKHLKHLNKLYNQLSNQIRESVRFIDFAHISNRFLIRNDRMMDKIRLTQEKKLIKLGLRTANETNDPEKVIFNFSTRILNSSEKSLLAKGLNLSIPPKKLNYADFLMPFEVLYKEMKTSSHEPISDKIDPVGASMKDAAYDCLYSYDPKVEQNLSADESNALKSLLNDKSIIIQKSDKGNSVVILNKTDYTNRMEELLSDQSKFRRIILQNEKDYNFIINQELRISKALRKLMQAGALPDSIYERLNPTGTQPSVIYGLSKVHKPVINGTPQLRPILSAINNPTYKLSQYLDSILKPYTANEYTVKDSFSFASEIRNQQSSNFMASLDVDSLFTNIPLTETIDICSDLVFQGRLIVDGLRKQDFKQLLTLATTESFILFNGNYYQQIDGVAMGSPLGPTLANIFLGHHEVRWLSECPVTYKPVHYKRYVNDIFLLFTSVDSINMFTEYMNSRHPSMHFTSEIENDNSIPFLDIFVSRNPTSFVTSVYRKPTFSGVYTHYESFLPSIYKTNLISTLLFRCYTICSSWSLIDAEVRSINSYMLKNGYPEQIVDRAISLFLNKLHSKKQPLKVTTQKQFHIKLPYLGTFSRRLEKKIKLSLGQYLPEFKVIFVYRAATRLKTLFAFKDKIPSYLSSGIIYKYKCSRCNSTYIGESIRHTKRRFCEHLGISALTGQPLKGQNPTTVSDHTKKCKCKISLNDFEILGRDSTTEYNRRIKESLFIHRDRPTLNIQGSSVPLHLFKN